MESDTVKKGAGSLLMHLSFGERVARSPLTLQCDQGIRWLAYLHSHRQTPRSAGSRRNLRPDGWDLGQIQTVRRSVFEPGTQRPVYLIWCSPGCLAGKGTEPITQTVSHKTLKEGCPGTPALTDVRMHTYAHTHSQNSESWRISSRGLLVWATTDVLRCIRYVAYKIPTKHFPLGTERWTASSCKTVPLSLAINWPWCWALSVNMCSVCRSTCEWRQGSRKAISNTCFLKSWRATKYIFVPPASYVIKKPITSQRKY